MSLEAKKDHHADFFAAEGDAVLPYGLEEIPARRFEGNTALVSITIPGTVKRIGAGAFAGCVNLERVVMQEGTEELGKGVFSGCVRLRQIVFPDSIRDARGWLFRDLGMTEPLFTISGRRLVFCPAAAAGREWSVPETVKVISAQAFLECGDLEILHLPEGLEEIGWAAFPACSLREIEIPASVRFLGRNAFWNCGKLEKVTILNPEIRIEWGAFSDCAQLKDIRWEGRLDTDTICHMRGDAFLDRHLEDPPNLPHTRDPAFSRLVRRAARGEAEAMNGIADFFADWSRRPGASLFYGRASHFWRYRAFRKGQPDAVRWFDAFFTAHPGERLESILYESSDHRAGMYQYAIPGSMLRALGFLFFAPDREYEIQKKEAEPLAEVSAFESYLGPDEDGYGAEYYYDWWFLDENLQPIQGISRVNATFRDREQPWFQKKREKAEAVLARLQTRRMDLSEKRR